MSLVSVKLWTGSDVGLLFVDRTDFKVLRPCFTDISAPSYVSRLLLQTDSPPILCLPSKRFQSCNLLSLILLWTPGPQAEVQLCNDSTGKNWCLHWDNIHQLTDDNI